MEMAWTSYEFLNRFTAAERTSFISSSDPVIQDFRWLASAAQEIFNTDPTTIAGMDYLVMVGLLTQERRNEIMQES